MAEQLFNHFADIQALEIEKKKVLSIYGEVKQGIIELSQLGFKIDTSKSVREITGYQKQIESLQAKMIDSQRKIDDAESRSGILRERLAKAEAARKREEIKLREDNERAINREIAAEQKKKPTLKDRPIESIPFEVRQGPADDGSDIAAAQSAEARAAAEEHLQAAIQSRYETENRGAKLTSERGAGVADSAKNTVAYADNLERLTGTLDENISLQLLYEQELKEVNSALKTLRAETNEDTKASAAYQARVQELTLRQATLKKESQELNQTIKNQIVLENGAAGALDKLNARLNLLNQQYAKLSATQKQSDFGRSIQTEIATLNTAVTAEEATLGKFTKSVGGYAKGIGDFAGKAFGALKTFAYLVPGLGIAGIMSIIVDVVIDAAKEIFQFGDDSEEAARKLKTLAVESDNLKKSLDDLGSTLEYINKLAKINLDISFGKGFQADLLDLQGQAVSLNELLGQLDEGRKKAEEIRQKAFANLQKELPADLQNKIDLSDLSILPKDIDSDSRELIESYKKIASNVDAIDSDILKNTQVRNVIYRQIEAARTNNAREESDKRAKEAKKRSEDLAKLNERERKDALDLYKYRQQLLIEEQKSFSELGPERGRIAARREQAKLEQEYIERVKEFELAQANLTADARILIEEKAANDIVSVRVKLEADLIKIRQEEKERGQKEAEEEYNRLVEEEDKKLKLKIDKSKEASDQATDTVETFRDKDLEKLEKKYSAIFKAARGNEKKEKKVLEEYNREREEIETRADLNIIKNKLIFYEEQLSILKAFGANTIEIEKAIANARAKIAEIENKRAKATKSEREKDKAELLDALEQIKSANDEVNKYIGGFLNASITRRKNQIQDQIDDIDRLKQAEIDRINASADSEEKKAAKIKLIEASAQSRKEQLELRSRKLDLERARFEKAAAIAQIILNTAVAVAKALGNPLKVAGAIALGAVQLAIAVATPLPKFFKGTESSPAGPAEVAEQGRELAIEPGGRVKLFSKHTVANLIKGTKIFPNKVTEDILSAAHVGDYKRVVELVSPADRTDEVVSELKEIKKRSGVTIVVENGMDVNWWSKYMKN